MAKYHVNPETGAPGLCRAVKQCRFGTVDHYDSRDDAQKAYEASQTTLTSVSKQNSGTQATMVGPQDTSSLTFQQEEFIAPDADNSSVREGLATKRGKYFRPTGLGIVRSLQSNGSLPEEGKFTRVSPAETTMNKWGEEEAYDIEKFSHTIYNDGDGYLVKFHGINNETWRLSKEAFSDDNAEETAAFYSKMMSYSSRKTKARGGIGTPPEINIYGSDILY